ncbi:hypothetical protein JCM17724A_21410 [Prevotella fusca JCM 17724]
MKDEKATFRCLVGNNSIRITSQPRQSTVISLWNYTLKMMLSINPDKLWSLRKDYKWGKEKEKANS